MVRPPKSTLSWSVHRDLAQLLSDWRHHVQRLGRDPFNLLLVLEAVRLQSPETDTFRYSDLEESLDISSATLRRWLRTLKTAGLVTTAPVPGSNRTAAAFRIHPDAARPQRGRSLSSERTIPPQFPAAKKARLPSTFPLAPR